MAHRIPATSSDRVAALVSAAILVGLVIAGCTSAPAPQASAQPVPPASPSPTEAPAAENDDTDTVLFTVDAAARAVDGTTVALSLVGHEPVPSTDPEATELIDEFLTACLDAGGASISEAGREVSEQSLAEHGSSLMRIAYTGTPEGKTLLAPVQTIVGIDNFALIGAGDGLQSVGSTDTCLNRYQLTRSSAGGFVANYETGTSDADPSQWVFGSYGFTVPVESGATLESCNVTITALGREDLDGVDGWQEGEVGNGLSCGTGFQGE